MKYIRSIRKIDAAVPNGKTIVYMLGYGGRMWQAARHLRVLQQEGYRLFVMDFVDILKRHDPSDLTGLMDEVSDTLEREELTTKETLLVGVSLGGLVGYNLVRRYPQLNKLLVVTGGDMTHIPSSKSLKKRWRLSREELARLWQDVNIYTPVGSMRDKHIFMLLPKRDKVIDPNEVSEEIAQHTHINDFTIIKTSGGHFRTIITETILAPKKSLWIIRQLARF